MCWEYQSILLKTVWQLSNICVLKTACLNKRLKLFINENAKHRVEMTKSI